MSDYSQQINDIFANGPVIGANAATILDPTWNATFNPDDQFSANAYINDPRVSICGVYTGAISSLGNMVAMALSDNKEWISGNTGASRIYQLNGQPITPSSYVYNPLTGGQTPVFTPPPGSAGIIYTVPFLSGYLRTYYNNPQLTTFGANSAIPALTGVMPSKFTDLQGNFVYYVDLQMTRLSGSQYWDNFYFINIFNQLVAYVLTTNAYTKGLLESEQKNLKYFGFNNYNEFITQGWSAYKGSEALIRSFNNIGKLVATIPDKIFGTSNGVVKSMIDNGLGNVGGLSDKLFNAGIIYQQIDNANYTQQLDAILQTITAPSDLTIIQQVLKTKVPTELFTSPLSYTSIQATSGLTNDSGFANLAEVGQDIFLKAPGSNFTLGVEVADLIAKIQTETSDSIESLATNDSLLTPAIVNTLRTYLPTLANNAPISMLNVIGTATGYYTEYIELVNEGIAELYATNYGPQIINILSEISRYFARVALSESENITASLYTPVPPPQTRINPNTGELDTIGGTGGYDWWQQQCFNKQAEYFALLNTIAADPAMKTIVNKININYDIACSFLYQEVTNYNKANISVSAFGDNSQIFSFVSSLPEYGIDRNQIGTDYILYQLSQPTVSGNIAQNILNQAKNSDFISNAGGKITGIV